MITNYKIVNYKSLRNVDLKIKNLNLLTGLNGSGKSSLIQTMLLLRQSKNSLKYIDPNSTLMIQGNPESRLFDGNSVEDIISHPINYSNPSILQIHIEYNNAENLNFNFRIKNDNPHENYKSNVFPSKDKNYYGDLENYTLFNGNFQYIFAERHHTKDFYNTDIEKVIDTSDFGVKGDNTPFYLATYGDKETVKLTELYHESAKDSSLIAQVDAWLGEISPNMSVFTKVSSHSSVEIKYGTAENYYKPRHVGFGLSYVLPIIVTLLTAKKEKLVIIENPEAHVHPKGQVELGKLFAKAAQAGIQLFIETHSDHILNGIRIAARTGKVDADKVGFFHFKRTDNESKISSILVDNDGKLYQKDKNGSRIGIPKDFFNEWVDSMAQLF